MQLFTPRSLKRWAQFYFELSQLTRAGILPSEAYTDISNHGSSTEIRKFSSRLSAQLISGKTLAQSLYSERNNIPGLDRALLAAGEKSGRLEEFFQKLGEYYAQIAEMRSRMLSLLIYPLGLIHLGILIFPSTHFSILVGQGFFAFIKLKIIKFAILWTVLSLPYFVYNTNTSNGMRKLLEQFFNKMPLIGKTRKVASLSRFCLALEALISAGILPTEAWSMAAHASDSVEIQEFTTAISPQLKKGAAISTVLKVNSAFPIEFVSQIRTAEKTGQMEQTLKRLSLEYEKQSQFNLKIISQWFPRIIYFVVVIYCAFNIYRELSSVTERIQHEIEK